MLFIVRGTCGCVWGPIWAFWDGNTFLYFLGLFELRFQPWVALTMGNILVNFDAVWCLFCGSTHTFFYFVHENTFSCFHGDFYDVFVVCLARRVCGLVCDSPLMPGALWMLSRSG